MTSNSSPYNYILVFSRRIIALISIVLGVVLLGFGIQRTDIDDINTDRPALLVVDTSLSMSVDDIVDANGVGYSRLDAAIEFLRIAFPDRMKGLMTFASSARLQIPFSDDRGLWKDIISELSVIRYGAPTDIETALASAMLIYADTPMDIVVLTDAESTVDGVSHTGVILSPDMRLHLIGIGTTEGGKIVNNYDGDGRIVYKKYLGQDIISRLDEEELMSLSEKHNASYSIIDTYSDIQDVGMAMDDIYPPHSTTRDVSFFYIFGAIFVCIGLVLPDYRHK